MFYQLIKPCKYFFLFCIITSFLSANNTISFSLGSKENSLFWYEINNFGINGSNQLLLSSKFNYGDKSSFHLGVQSKISHTSFSNTYIEYQINEKNLLKAGRYYRDFSNYLNDNLSSGSMLISQNSEALPKVGYVGHHSLKNINVYFKYGLAHAQFDKNENYSSPPFLHEKFLYIYLSKNDYSFGLGLVHEAIWGGTTNFGKQPATFEDFFRIFRASHGDEDAHIGDQVNALGNHLGIWDFIFTKKINSKSKIKIYHQHIFEDDSGFKFKNNNDGLWGIEILLNDTNLLFEYLDTSHQSGYDTKIGNDSYYNHNIYNEGWSYRGNTLGNPFIAHKKNIPVQLAHFGFAKKFNSLNVSILFTEKTPISKSDLFLLSIDKKFSNVYFGIGLGNSIDNKISLSSFFSLSF